MAHLTDRCARRLVSPALMCLFLLGCRRRERPHEPAVAKPLALRVDACAVPDTANAPPESQFTIPKGCVLRVDKDWIIDHDARVTIGQGATISFAKGTGLYVVHGTLAVPGGVGGAAVRFTSADASPAPGDWRGIVVHQSTFGFEVDGDYNSYVARAQLSNVIIEYAGAEACPPPDPRGVCTRCSRGAFTVARGAVNVHSLYGATFRHNRDAQIDTTCARGVFNGFTHNVFEGSATPLRVQLGTAPSLGSVGVPVVLVPSDNEGVRLPSGEYHVEQPLGAKSLEISEGSTIRVAPGVRISLQKLVAKDVAFTWMGDKPWAGLLLRSEDSSIDGCSFEHVSSPAIDLSVATKLHHVWDNVFRDVSGPAIRVSKGICTELNRQNNRSENTPLCAP